jgi:hypothetical protein
VQLELNQRSNADEKIMMSASIKKQYKQLVFRIFRDRKLPIMDTFGTIDAYVKTMFMRQTRKSKYQNGEGGMHMELGNVDSYPVASRF